MCACVNVYHMSLGVLSAPEKDVRSLGAKVAGGCELPSVGAANQTRLPLEEQCVLLATEQSLQTHFLCIYVPC